MLIRVHAAFSLLAPPFQRAPLCMKATVQWRYASAMHTVQAHVCRIPLSNSYAQLTHFDLKRRSFVSLV
jgi:hypothetical protein